MKFEPIAKAALLAMLVTACSGDEASQDDAMATTQPEVVVVESPTSVAPTTTAVAGAPTPTTAAPIVEAPTSLAFASASDIGRLFEVASGQTTYTSANRDVTLSAVEAGQLVQATSARSRDDTLVVQVRDPESEESLGWIPADSLNPTQRYALTEDPSQSGELRITRRSSDPVAVVSEPGTLNVVGTLASQEIAMHGGAVALVATGETYLDVIDSTSRARVGWVAASSFGRVTSPVAQNQDNVALRTRANSAVEYGAPLQSVTVVQVGCNAAQVEFTNPSVSLGLAVVLGQSIPQGEPLASIERWTSTQGGTVYLAPGETATITLLTDLPRVWYFAGLDDQLRATTDRNPDGSLVNEPAEATRFQQIDLAGGSCVYVPPVEEEEFGYGGSDDPPEEDFEESTDLTDVDEFESTEGDAGVSEDLQSTDATLDGADAETTIDETNLDDPSADSVTDEAAQ